ncbi:RecA-superfamily ATPase implicated in signal transduction [Halanaeroarchaeum sp. HSR-CO]|uniref:ATPase domain-containing protein n=1 Tax=Halanaeroarchaeum sp. HSR-CO TaxID=2866382 RepID=UPI00217EE8F9|nr:ATPase domain-containing protein [Halanaeroarchaeum sp. HSR-CO]UWG48413.1 RecA-superfamily ATPase implicated in signal transduction [Halanaeroarchaeum sp. HSR-CO]
MQPEISSLSSGVPALDTILHGGYIVGRLYLIRGHPGTGKTLAGMHFLEEGIQQGETVLFIHGEESETEILANAAQFDIDLSDANFLDLGPESEFFTESKSHDLVDPSDVDRDQHTESIYNAIAEINPSRVVIDPITQIRYVEANEYEFRKRILAFMRFLKGRETTVLATTTPSQNQEFDVEMQSLADGVIEMERGEGGRRVEITKHRGYGQAEGDHGLEIRSQGLEVYPALIPEQRDRSFDPERISSGIDGLDTLVGGGIESGTVTIVSGPTGVGKTTTGSLFLTEAAQNGTTATLYLFEESEETFTYRLDALGMPITELREQGTLQVREVEPLSLSAEEFAEMVRSDVEENGTELVMIDGIDGYTMSLQGTEEGLVRKLHSLTRVLKNRGVSVFVTDEISTITGLTSATSSNISYIADNILFLSYMEVDGELHKVIGTLKKRAGDFEQTLREFDISQAGIFVGEPLSGVSGILDGSPHFTSPAE